MAVRETIEIVRRAARDRFGDAPPLGTPVPVRGCKVWPRTGVEEGTGAEVILDGQNVFIPKGKPLPTATDTVRLRGDDYEVVGTPGIYPGKGAIVILSRVSGGA